MQLMPGARDGDTAFPGLPAPPLSAALREKIARIALSPVGSEMPVPGLASRVP